jgi:putative ABC transport system permease protein
LARTPARSGHTATMILVGVSLIIGVATISAGAVGGGEQIFKRQVKYDLVISQPEGAPVGVSEETLDKIRGLDGIDAADGFNFIDSESGGERLSMAAFEPGEWRHLSSLFFRAGRGWVTDPGNRTWRALQDGGIFVGSDYAKQRNLRVGDYLSLQTDTDGRARFKIAALVDHFLLGSSQMTSSNMVFMSRATAKTYFSAKTQAGAGALNGGTGTVYELMIKLKSGVDRKTVSAEIKELLDKGTGLELVTDEQVHEHLRRLMRGPDTFIILIFAISIIVGLLGVVNTVAMSVFQRYRELGLLRAVGASAKQLRKMVLLETVLLVLIGVFFGVLLGTVVSAIFVAGIGSIEFAFPFVFPWLQVLILILLVLAAGLAAGLYPARLAVRIPITDALRYE